MPNEVFKNDSNDFISNIKETVDVTLATDDDRQLEAHNKSFANQQASNFKKNQLDNNILIIIPS